MKLKYHNAIRQQNNEFKVNQMRKEMAKENKFLFMKLVDIQNGKHPMLKFDTADVRGSNERYSGLGGYNNNNLA